MNKTMKIIFAFSLLLSIALTVTAKPRTVKPKVQRARVEITEQGYKPASIKLRKGIPARVTFLRKTDATCAKEVVISAYGINRNLPLNEAVVVAFTPNKTGEFIFTCGMNMMRGKLIVK
jgi:plastocyanin domain-containing protein